MTSTDSTLDTKFRVFFSFTDRDDTSCVSTQLIRCSRARSRRYVPFKKDIAVCLYCIEFVHPAGNLVNFA